MFLMRIFRAPCCTARSHASMFRVLSHRAIEAFVRRHMSISEGPVRRGIPLAPGSLARPDALLSPDALIQLAALLQLGVPPALSASGPAGMASQFVIRVPMQGRRAPYLEDIDDWS
jgi:hypothetical protein